MEKSHQEPREILARDHEEHREQMAQIIEVIMRLSQRKRMADDAGSMNTTARTQWVTEGPMYNPYHSVSHTMPEVGTPY